MTQQQHKTFHICSTKDRVSRQYGWALAGVGLTASRITAGCAGALCGSRHFSLAQKFKNRRMGLAAKEIIGNHCRLPTLESSPEERENKASGELARDRGVPECRKHTVSLLLLCTCLAPNQLHLIALWFSFLTCFLRAFLDILGSPVPFSRAAAAAAASSAMFYG